MVLVDRFQPTKVLGLIQEHKISVFLAIPSMYRVLAATEGDFDVSSVRFPISGGEPLPVAIALAFEKRFPVPIYEGYGQTEAAPVVTLTGRATESSAPSDKRCLAWKLRSGTTTIVCCRLEKSAKSWCAAEM